MLILSFGCLRFLRESCLLYAFLLGYLPSIFCDFGEKPIDFYLQDSFLKLTQKSGPPNIGKSALKRNCELYERSQRLSRMVSIVQSQLYPTRTKMQMFNCPHGKMYA